MGFHLKIKLATRPNCRPDGNFALNKIRDSVKMDLLSGFKDWFFWQNWIQIWLPALYFQFQTQTFQKSLPKGQKSFGQTLATLPNCRPDGDFFQN